MLFYWLWQELSYSTAPPGSSQDGIAVGPHITGCLTLLPTYLSGTIWPSLIVTGYGFDHSAVQSVFHFPTVSFIASFPDGKQKHWEILTQG